MNQMTAQPTDRTDPLYKLIADNLAFGDRKEIAEELGVDACTVSLVLRGRGKSKKVWNKLVARAMKRKAEKDKVTQYLSKSI
jgi:hypothetical protein